MKSVFLSLPSFSISLSLTLEAKSKKKHIYTINDEKKSHYENGMLFQWNLIFSPMKRAFAVQIYCCERAEWNTSCMLQLEKNNNEGSVKNNHKLYIFLVTSFATYTAAATNRNRCGRRLSFTFLSNPKLCASYINSYSYCCNFIDAHMILSHHMHSFFFRSLSPAVHILFHHRNALNVTIIM